MCRRYRSKPSAVTSFCKGALVLFGIRASVSNRGWMTIPEWFTAILGLRCPSLGNSQAHTATGRLIQLHLKRLDPNVEACRTMRGKDFGYSSLGSQTRLGLFVRPLLIAESQYSELLSRAAWPSRNVNWAPRVWRLVCTKFAGPTAGRFFESNNQTTTVDLGMLESLMGMLLAPVPLKLSFRQ